MAGLLGEIAECGDLRGGDAPDEEDEGHGGGTQLGEEGGVSGQRVGEE